MYCVAFQGQRDRNPHHWYICSVGEAGEEIDFTASDIRTTYWHLHRMKRYHPTVDYKIMNYETVKMLNELTGDF